MKEMVVCGLPVSSWCIRPLIVETCWIQVIMILIDENYLGFMFWVQMNNISSCISILCIHFKHGLGHVITLSFVNYIFQCCLVVCLLLWSPSKVCLTINFWKQLCWYKRGPLQSKNGSCYSCTQLEKRISGKGSIWWNNCFLNFIAILKTLTNWFCFFSDFSTDRLILVYFIFLLQWVVLTRKHAEVVVKDDTVFPMFQLYCKVSCGKNIDWLLQML